MSGVWEFNHNGAVRLVENSGAAEKTKPKVLVHIPSKEVITSYSDLEQHLSALGWERYEDDPTLLQFHKRNNPHLISLPIDFSGFSHIHMYDIIVKNRNMFEVRDM